MFEILFIFGAFGWLLGAACEYLSGLAAFPTILVGFILIPVLACADYLEILNKLELTGLHQRREPVPPERFYWMLHRNRLLRTVGWVGALAAAAWFAAIWWPASFSPEAVSLVGWVAGLLAVVSTARFTSHCAPLHPRFPLVRQDGTVGIGRVPPDVVPPFRQPGFPRSRR